MMQLSKILASQKLADFFSGKRFWGTPPFGRILQKLFETLPILINVTVTSADTNEEDEEVVVFFVVIIIITIIVNFLMYLLSAVDNVGYPKVQHVVKLKREICFSCYTLQ